MNETALTSNQPQVSLRPLALPNEHGGWGFVLEPIAVALIVAPSGAGFAIGVAAVAVFLARHPLCLAIGDSLRRRRFPRTVVCEELALLYIGFAVVAAASAISSAGVAPLLPFVLAAPLAITQFGFDARRMGRTLTPELAGAVAAGASAAAIALAGGTTLTIAVMLWLLTALRSVPSIVLVRAALGRETKMTAVVLHVAALAVTIVLWQQKLVPVTAPFAIALLLSRATLLTPRGIPARRLGIRELVYGAAVTLLFGLGYRLF